MHQSEHDAHPMSQQDFAMLGIHQIAYVKPVGSGGKVRFAVYAADGTEIANIENDRDVAFAAVRQHDMEPVSVH